MAYGYASASGPRLGPPRPRLATIVRTELYFATASLLLPMLAVSLYPASAQATTARSAHDCQIWLLSSWSIRQLSTHLPCGRSFGTTTLSTISRLYGPHMPVHDCSVPCRSIPSSSQKGWKPQPVCRWLEPWPHAPVLVFQARGTGFLRHMTPALVPVVTLTASKASVRPPTPPHRSVDSPTILRGCWLKHSSSSVEPRGHRRYE
mmetsp:Transcript_48428/g.134239  ORF Transcript_48428/g.134239 Transcript_48428/m.134239 type:complete len:205 (+) Transcript_48428:131-745(+)